jgi:ribosome biogenesis GTPase / thiamine phosphate phosphatase
VNGLVLRVSGWEILVAGADGEEHLCQLRGKVKAGPRRAGGQVVAGDGVDWRPTEAGRGIIESILPRQNILSRTASGNRPLEQVMAANVDRFFIVVSAREPALRPGFVDRALVMAASGGVEGVVVCINKIDLDEDDERREIVSLYRMLGYEVIETSATTGAGMADLVERFHSGLSVLIGPSGAGKSSILNTVEPGLAIRTQELMRHHDRGRHTTTSSSLHRLRGGGYVADTPGVKQLQPWGIAVEELAGYFPELAARIGDCQFRDCTHLHEPGCLIRDAVHDGRIAASRYDSFGRIYAETDEFGDHRS